MLVLPGLINAHHHGMGISSVQLGFPDPGPPEPGLHDTAFESWMATMLALDAVDPYLNTLYKNVLQIESGITSHLHMHFPSGTGDGAPEQAYAAELQETLRAHRDAGQRVTLAPHWSDRSRLAYDGDEAFISALPADLQARARRAAGARMPVEAYLATVGDLVRGLADDPLLSAQFSIMAPQWASDELVFAVGSAAADADAGIHLHALESRLQRAWGDGFANAGELQRLADAQVLTDRSALAHGVWLRDSDIELLASSGTTVVHNCASNLRLAAGVAPLRQLVACRRRRRTRAGRHGRGRRRRHARRGPPRARAAARARRGRAPAPARGRDVRPDVGRRRARHGSCDADRPTRAGAARRRRRARPASTQRPVRGRRRRRVGAAARPRQGGRMSTA